MIQRLARVSVVEASGCRCLSLLRRFSSAASEGNHGMDHLRVTQSTPRRKTKHTAVIDAIEPITPTVVKVTLTAQPSARGIPFDFRPGQWVDFVINPMFLVGGFSMISTPSTLPSFELAVKRSSHRPAAWVHTIAQPGDEVVVRAGGDFTLDFGLLKASGKKKLLMVAGGVGINPLYSILKQAEEENVDTPIKLLYSCRGLDEVAFGKEIMALTATLPSLEVQLHITGDPPSSSPASSALALPTTEGRMHSGTLDDALAGTPVSDTHCLVCGPKSLTDAMEEECEDRGLTLQFEKWW